MDAGADSSQLDADSSQSDAAVDSSGAEDVAGDSSQSDAAVDSGPVDAGSEDAGSEDAGSKDAGSKDAGSEDAGPVDKCAKVTCKADNDTACSKAACDPADGVCKLQPVKDGAACDAGDKCTGPDTCKAGKCVAGGHTTAACDDGDKCTDKDACKAGKCQGAAIVCKADGNPCTAASCDKAKGACVQLPAQATCSDGEPCTGQPHDLCKDGKCSPGAENKCDDGDPCSGPDFCVKGKGCAHPENATMAGKACDPKDSSKICKAGKCTVGCKDAKDCDDGNVCTDDTCTAGKCGATANTLPCDDKQSCTLNDVCQNKACAAGAERYFAIAPAVKDVIGWGDVVRQQGGNLAWLGTAKGTSGNDAVVATTDERGKLLGSATYGGTGNQNGAALAAGFAPGELLVCGQSTISGKTTYGDLYVSRIGADGKQLWQTLSGGADNEWCSKVLLVRPPHLNSVRVATFGGRQTAPGNDGSRNLVLRIFDRDGKALANKAFDPSGSYDYDQDMIGTPDGHVAICSQSFFGHANGRYDAYIAKIHVNNLSMLWSKQLNSSGNQDDTCHALANTSDGGILALTSQPGGSGRRIAIIRLAANGTWKSQHLLPDSGKEYGIRQVLALPGGGFAYSGYRHDGGKNVAIFGRLGTTANPLLERLLSEAGPSQAGRFVALDDGSFAVAMNFSGKTPAGRITRLSPWGHSSCKAAGKCAEPAKPGCDDGKGCTFDACDAAKGCSSTKVLADNSACEDGQACTVGQSCKAGVCQGGAKRLYARTVAGKKVELHSALQQDDGTVIWPGTGYTAGSNNPSGHVRRIDPAGTVLKTVNPGGSTGVSWSKIVRSADGRIVTCGRMESGSDT